MRFLASPPVKPGKRGGISAEKKEGAGPLRHGPSIRKALSAMSLGLPFMGAARRAAQYPKKMAIAAAKTGWKTPRPTHRIQ